MDVFSVMKKAYHFKNQHQRKRMVNNDYLCHRCGYKWEQLSKRNDRVDCPKCKSGNVRKLISAPTFHKNIISDASLRKENII